MTLAELRTEVEERGFNHKSSARINLWINRAYKRICTRYPWFFLETTTTGSSPLTISDLRSVLSVVDTTNDSPLYYEDFRTIRDWDPELSANGAPSCWYLSAPTVIATYPTQAVDLSVRYVKAASDLSADADEPLIPEDFHYVIVDGAVGFAYRDSDNFDAAAAVDAEFEKGLQEMVDVLLTPNLDTSPTTILWGSTDW